MTEKVKTIVQVVIWIAREIADIVWSRRTKRWPSDDETTDP